MGRWVCGIQAAVVLCGLTFSDTIPPPDSGLALLAQAAENQYRGSYSSGVIFVRESFLRGRDSLHGRLEFNDSNGERQLHLKGRDQAFDWWSRNFGQEQWWMDGNSERLHRIPFRSLKKPAFASLLSYEDLIKLPGDYLPDALSCRKVSETDSICELKILLRKPSRLRYASLEISLQKNPVLLRRIVFWGADGRKLKSLEVLDYRKSEGKYLPVGLSIFDGDSLASVRMSLSNPSVIPAGADNTRVRNNAVIRKTEEIQAPDPE